MTGAAIPGGRAGAAIPGGRAGAAGVRRFPVDSSDVLELREADLERHAEDQAHAAACAAGLLGVDDDGRPVPCPRCRTDLFPRRCPGCGRSAAGCSAMRSATGCCDHCHHPRLPDLQDLLARTRGRSTTTEGNPR